MGRKKVKMELIQKHKARNIAFKKRKEGLIRKMKEFTTLCDVDACIIIYGPKQENGADVEPEIWPQEPDEVGRMVNIYKAKKLLEDSGIKTFGLNDFFHERKKKIEDELSKLRMKNLEAKYPTKLNDEMEQWNLPQLRQFAADLSLKVDYINSRIEILKTSSNRQQQVMEDTCSDLMHFGNTMSLNGQFYPPPPMHFHYPPSTIDHHQQLLPINPNSSMMMLLTNGGDQFGGGPTSGANFQSASFRSQVFYEATTSSSGGRGLVDPMICHDTWPMTCYYGQSQPLPLPPPPGFTVAPPEHTSWENHDGSSYEEKIKYERDQ
ncbi:hypothetical protein ACS0TY_015048 [Phlomoides rotata]